MLDDLTEEQESVLEAVANEYLAVFDRGDEIDLAAVRPGLEMIYGLYELPLPQIEICDSPDAAISRAKALGIAAPYFDWCGIGDAGWLAHYETFSRLGQLSDAETLDLKKHQQLMFGGVYDTILLDARAILVRFPHRVRLNERGDLHCEDGPAIAWRDGMAEHAWHGVFVPKKLIEAPESVTKSEALQLPTEERRAFCERIGWDTALALFSCELRDTWTDPGTGLLYELFMGPDDAILRKQSPKLLSGLQPLYSESVHRGLETAQAARKWQSMRPGLDPAIFALACNRDPELTYGFEA